MFLLELRLVVKWDFYVAQGKKTMNISMVPLLNYIIRAVEIAQPTLVGKSLTTFSSTVVH